MKRNDALNCYFNALYAWAMTHRVDTKAYYETFGMCVNHTAKMTDLYSFSTSCLCNGNCKARLNNPDMICYHCLVLLCMINIRHLLASLSGIAG